jgi:hypothetical protein
MNYLTGPLTRAQIPQLNELVGAKFVDAVPETTSAASSTASKAQDVSTPAAIPPKEDVEQIGTATAPALPTGIAEYYLPNNKSFAKALQASGESSADTPEIKGMIYRPALLAQAHIRFLNRKYDLDAELTRTALITDPDRRGIIRWEKYPSEPIDEDNLDQEPDPRIRFASIEAPLSDGKLLRSLKKDFQDWGYRESEVVVRSNEELDVYAGPDVSSREFREMCAEAARKERDAEIDKVESSFDRKLDSIEAKIKREQRELEEDRDELEQRRMEEFGTHAETVMSLFSKRKRRISTSLTKRRMTKQAQADVEESEKAIEDYMEQMEELEAELKEAVEDVKERWGGIANQVDEISVRPYKKDVLIDLYGVAWVPYYVVQSDDETIELLGYGKG